MVRPIRLPVAVEQRAEPSAGPIQRVQGLAGVAIVAMTVSILGLPLSGGHLATDLLLVVLGYKLTTRLRQGQYEDRNIMRFWLGHLGRVGIPMLVALGLTVTYWSWAGVVTGTRFRAAVAALTLNLNVVEGMGGEHFVAIEHLKLIALISQFALVLPILLVLSRRLRAYQRTLLFACVGAVAAIGRVAIIAGGSVPEDAGLLAGLTRADGLLFGAAIAVAPLPVLRRLMPTGLAGPVFAALLGLMLIAPRSPGIALAPLTVLSIGAAMALTTAAAGAGLTGPLANVVDRRQTRWLGARSLSIFIWHALAGVVVLGWAKGAGTGPNQTIELADGQWPGLVVFGVAMLLTVVTAAISYRFVELPLAALARTRTARIKPDDGLVPQNDSIGVVAAEPGRPAFHESGLTSYNSA